MFENIFFKEDFQCLCAIIFWFEIILISCVQCTFNLRKNPTYVFIERKTHTIHGGGACWLYTCSCDTRKSSLVNSLASDLHLGSANCFGIAILNIFDISVSINAFFVICWLHVYIEGLLFKYCWWYFQLLVFFHLEKIN